MNIYLLFYTFLSSITFLSGLLFFKNKNNSILIFLSLLLLLPTSDQFMFITSFNGVYFYDYYFLALIIYCFKRNNLYKLKEIILRNKFIIIISSSLILYYISLIIFNSTPIDKYVLRDFRPFLLFASLIIFIKATARVKIQFHKIFNILTYLFLIKILFFITLFILNPIEDPYYQSYLYRYRDGTTFLAVIYLIIYLFKKEDIIKLISKNSTHIILLLAIMLVLISNLRILLPAIIFVYIIMHQTNYNNFLKKILYSIIFIASFLGYSYIMPKIQYELHGKEKIILRIKNLEDRKLSKVRINKEKKILKKGYKPQRYNTLFSKVGYQLEARFFPAKKYINELTFLNTLFGNGFAKTFEISAFNYRGLDIRNNKIDSFYITHFIKYGIIGLLLLVLLFFKVISLSIKEKKLRYAVISFYLIVFLVTAIFYQPGAIVHLLFIKIVVDSLTNSKLLST